MPAGIDCWGAGVCRGMLASGSAREAGGGNAFAPGGGGGDHSSPVSEVGLRGNAGRSSGGRAAHTEAGGSRCGEQRERSSSSESG